MSNSRFYRGFTLIELLVVISIIALLISILLPALGSARQAAQQMQNSTQLRGIHQGMYIFSQENKGFFPGPDNDGQPLAGGEGTASQNDPGSTYRSGGTGTHPLRRLSILLDSNLFPPEYMINPADTARELADPSITTGANVETANYSYTMTQIHFHDQNERGVGSRWNETETWIPSDRGLEWQDTANSSAIMMADRAIADDGSDGIARRNVINYHSLWTKQNSGSWTGSVQRNDGSVQYGSRPDGFTAQYGNGPTIVEDNIFVRAEGRINGVLAPADSNTVVSSGQVATLTAD